LYLSYEKIPKILLLGNGINRAYDYASWDDLIKSISTKSLTSSESEAMKTVPYPLQPVILTNDHVDIQIRKISGSLSAEQAPVTEEKLLRKFAMLPVDAILTTNYTYEMEKALIPEFKCVSGRKCKWRKVAYEDDGKYCKEQLHTYFSAEKYSPTIWHIHGEASRPDTMILGHYFYGKLLAKMQQSVPHIIRRYNVSQSKKQDLKLHSWLDYFMLGDVYIVGCGLALSEIDLWWMVNCKKRNFPNSKIVLYKPDIKPEEKMLADAYGIDVMEGDFNGDFKEYYELICAQLGNALKI
jgi:hypothetical protein